MFIVAACLVFALELLMYVPELWKYRRVITSTLLVFNAGLFVALISQQVTLGLVLVVSFVTVFRYINFSRIIKNRTNPQYLRSSSFKTTVYLGTTTILVGGTYFGLSQFSFNGSFTLMSLQLLLSLGLLAVTILSIFKLKAKYSIYNYAERDLPTVTVCVPARNETEQMEICITNLLASTYPKLEIIVLDDCSTDTTPEIIKKFAHDGVRFIRGKMPDEEWLPKNQAYQRLTEEASGQFLLFCGVDTKFGTQTITKLVSLALTHRLQMVSILPIRLANSGLSGIIQPMRYWWELALPRWAMKSPPVLSTTWLVKNESLKKIGGFDAVKRSVLPERYFAKRFSATKQYAFISTNDAIDIQTSKPVSDQRETAIRIRYPQVHRRPELVMVVSAFQLSTLIAPYIMLPYGLIAGNGLYIVPVVVIIINTLTHLLIVGVSNPANVPLAMINFPVVLITEIVLGFESMLRYEFSSVEWKDRNICLPVMHVIPRLPKV